MNERIKQLAKQAGLDDDICPLDEWDHPELEKFAELIVQDCISKLAWAPQSSGPEGLGEYNQGWVNGRALAVEHIKEHFGVEE